MHKPVGRSDTPAYSLFPFETLPGGFQWARHHLLPATSENIAWRFSMGIGCVASSTSCNQGDYTGSIRTRI